MNKPNTPTELSYSVKGALEIVRAAVDCMSSGLSKSDRRVLLQELLRDAEGWRAELEK